MSESPATLYSFDGGVKPLTVGRVIRVPRKDQGRLEEHAKPAITGPSQG